MRLRDWLDIRQAHLEIFPEMTKPLTEIEWLRLMLHLYQRTEYPESCCPWEQAFRNRLNEVAGQGQLFLHGEVANGETR